MSEKEKKKIELEEDLEKVTGGALTTPPPPTPTQPDQPVETEHPDLNIIYK